MDILLIEDDFQLNTTIRKFLISLGYKVTSAFDGEESLGKIDKHNYQIYIVDINIPNVNGLDVVEYIRKKDLSSIIIIITASMELSKLQQGFENGCSDYIKKPFFLEELQIRMDNLLKREQNKIIHIDSNITFNMQYKELIINNKVVKLRKKERKLLTLLLKNYNHTVDTETICSYVWENEVKENYPLRQLVSELRKYFNTGKNFIFADIGVGYRFEIKN